MNRRRFLGATGTALSSMTAGCLDGPLGLHQSGRAVSLADVGTVGEDHPFRLEASLRRRTMRPGVAPEVEISLRSTTEDAMFLGYAERWPADGLLPNRNSHPPGIRLLAAAEVSDFTVDSEPCPHTAYRPATEPSRGGHRVGPDTPVRVRYRVLASDQALDGGCPGAGSYRWRSTYAYAAAAAVERVGFEDATQGSFSWGFTIEVPDED